MLLASKEEDRTMKDCEGCKGTKEIHFKNVGRSIECPFCDDSGRFKRRGPGLQTDLKGIYSSSARFMNYEEGNSYAQMHGEYWDRLLNRFKW